MKNKVIIAIVIVIAVGMGFFGGMKYQQSQAQTRFAGSGNFQRGSFGQGQNGATNGQFQRRNTGFQPVSGEIISSDATGITVKLMDGSSKIILFTDKTAINKSDTATKADVKTGEKVAVFGTTNSDGSVSAQSVQLNPQQMRIRTSQPTGTK